MAKQIKISIDLKTAELLKAEAVKNGETQVGVIRNLLKDKIQIRETLEKVKELQLKKESGNGGNIDNEKLEQMFWILKLLFEKEKWAKDEAFKSVFSILAPKLPTSLKK